MWLKLSKRTSLIVGLLIGSSILFSCVEEPTIAPVKLPFSVIRIGNLTANIESFNMYIDGELVTPSPNRKKFTDYFDLVSGDRQIVLLDVATGDTIFNYLAQIGAYKELSIFFGGFYTDTVDYSFKYLVKTEGTTYIDESPVSDSLFLYVINACGKTPLNEETLVNITAYWTIQEDTTFRDTSAVVNGDSLSYKGSCGKVMSAGSYEFVITVLGDSIAAYKGELENGTFSYLYLTGDPLSPEVTFEKKMPLPVRPK
jgi:hypothetical protein